MLAVYLEESSTKAETIRVTLTLMVLQIVELLREVAILLVV